MGFSTYLPNWEKCGNGDVEIGMLTSSLVDIFQKVYISTILRSTTYVATVLNCPYHNIYYYLMHSKSKKENIQKLVIFNG